jgi:hypothetical protein
MLNRIRGELRVTAPTLLPMLESCSWRPLLPPLRLLLATAAPPPAQMPLLRLLRLVRRCSASMIALEGLSMSSRVLSVASTSEQRLVTSCTVSYMQAKSTHTRCFSNNSERIITMIE